MQTKGALPFCLKLTSSTNRHILNAESKRNGLNNKIYDHRIRTNFGLGRSAYDVIRRGNNFQPTIQKYTFLHQLEWLSPREMGVGSLDHVSYPLRERYVWRRQPKSAIFHWLYLGHVICLWDGAAASQGTCFGFLYWEKFGSRWRAVVAVPLMRPWIDYIKDRTATV